MWGRGGGTEEMERTVGDGVWVNPGIYVAVGGFIYQ